VARTERTPWAREDEGSEWTVVRFGPSAGGDRSAVCWTTLEPSWVTELGLALT
jgi:hypothetical protein